MKNKRSEHPSYNYYILSEVEETEGIYVSKAERQYRSLLFHFMSTFDTKKFIEDLNVLIGNFSDFKEAFSNVDLDGNPQIILQSWGYFTTQYIEFRSISNSLKELRVSLFQMNQLGIYFEYTNNEVKFFCECNVDFPKFPTSFYVSTLNPDEEFENVETWIDQVSPTHFYDHYKTAEEAALRFAFDIYGDWKHPIFVYDDVTREITTYKIRTEVIERKTWPT